MASREAPASSASLAPAPDLDGSLLHRLDRVLGAVLDVRDQRCDLLGGAGALGELTDFVGDDREALALLAGPGRLDGGVERQQVRLLGDVIDGFDDAPICSPLAPSSVTFMAAPSTADLMRPIPATDLRTAPAPCSAAVAARSLTSSTSADAVVALVIAVVISSRAAAAASTLRAVSAAPASTWVMTEDRSRTPLLVSEAALAWSDAPACHLIDRLGYLRRRGPRLGRGRVELGTGVGERVGRPGDAGDHLAQAYDHLRYGVAELVVIRTRRDIDS